MVEAFRAEPPAYFDHRLSYCASAFMQYTGAGVG
jgi:hypothetical protein